MILPGFADTNRVMKGTYTGHYEPVKEMADLLDEYEAKTGHSVPIHGLSAASSLSFMA